MYVSRSQKRASDALDWTYRCHCHVSVRDGAQIP